MHLVHGFLVPLKLHAVVAAIAAEVRIERRVSVPESGASRISQMFTEAGIRQ